MQPHLLLYPGFFAFYGHHIEAQAHCHRALQLVLNKALEVQQIITSQQPHALTLAAGWVVLIEPQSDLAQRLCGDMTEQQQAINVVRAQLETGSDTAVMHDPLSSGLIIDHLDPRLQHLLQQLDGCLKGNCLTPEHWLAAEVSAKLALSESRFLHLFRQHMGIAWRPYLLWRRLLCAVQQMAHGHSATAAAHQAGFADSAHLSRTFRSTFGMTIRQASRLLRASDDR